MTREDEYVRRELPAGLRLLDLPQAMTGFRQFIASWFFVDPSGRRILVDPGPASSIDLLLDKLSEVTDGVDLVLLTHIHLDHSGGIGQFCERRREAKVLAHPKARRHLLDPGKLWSASIHTLGDIAKMYGEPAPLDPGALLEGCEVPGVTTIETPGHAPHHLSFIAPFEGEKLFFAGEAAGLCIPMETASSPYIHPTTPPKYDHATARDSLCKLEAAISGDELLCYSHWGLSRDARTMISLAKKQIDEWLKIISGMADQPEDAIVDRLLSEDPLLSGYADLPDDLRERERIFIRSSVTGFLMYIAEG
ncbi:MAG: MBL fold metallo-hydrolase [Synergistaceae bacterium]|jgi:glyoxylase-like metal-dependent hydrolase (beta-lactamase superfamily II)|nr:MBL fold metallo-hydrolase [Synergistaceae bacterium]